MHVKIGPYRSWVGPYQIAEILCFWAKDVEDEYGFKSKPDWVHDFGEKLAGTWIYDICQWIEDRKQRKVKIRVDPWDTWGMDHTLGLIILPMLKQLKETRHGSPFVDDEDVPEHLRSYAAKPLTKEEQDQGYPDNNHHERWDFVLDEMIWAFETSQDDDWEEQFQSGEHDMLDIPVDENGNEVPEDEAKFFEMVEGPNHTFKIDFDARQVYVDRMRNGFRLMGVYWQGLWD